MKVEFEFQFESGQKWSKEGEYLGPVTHVSNVEIYTSDNGRVVLNVFEGLNDGTPRVPNAYLVLTKSEARALGSALMGCAAEISHKDSGKTGFENQKVTSEFAPSDVSEDAKLGRLLREHAMEMERLLPDHDVMKEFRKTLRQILKK